MYRAPGASEFEVKTWDWAMAEIGQRIKKTRDATWVATAKVRRQRRNQSTAPKA